MVVDSRIHILRHRTLQSFSPPAVGPCREAAPFPLEAANDDGMSDFGLHLLHLHLPGFHLDVHCLGQVLDGNQQNSNLSFQKNVSAWTNSWKHRKLSQLSQLSQTLSEPHQGVLLCLHRCHMLSYHVHLRAKSSKTKSHLQKSWCSGDVPIAIPLLITSFYIYLSAGTYLSINK